MSSFTKVHISSHQNMPFFKGSSTESPGISPHKPCLLSKTLPHNIHTSCHTKHVFSITLLYRKFIHPHPKHVFLHVFHKESHILSPPPCTFSMALPHKFNSHILPHKPCLLSEALPQIIHISCHTNHALIERLFHRKFTHPLTQHMSFYKTSFNETKAAYVKELPRKVNPV